MSKIILPNTLEDVLRTTPEGSVKKAITNTLYGINNSHTKPPLEPNTDLRGYVFMTRPLLNLTSTNVGMVRQLHNLLTDGNMSIQRYVRCMLAPRLMVEGDDDGKGALSCPLVDNDLAFIPVVTNTITALSGWPDIVIPTFTSEPGVYKEQWSQVDGISAITNAFDLDLTFQNHVGSPALNLFHAWTTYQTSVFTGIMHPYSDVLTENEIDYHTRIYRLVMDSTNTYVTYIGATGASFPINNPMGSFFDFNSETPGHKNDQTFTIRFRCIGADYMDDIVVREFNNATQIFNGLMRDGYREKHMVKLNKELQTIFKSRGHPYINEETYELEWWIYKETFDNLVNGDESNA